MVLSRLLKALPEASGHRRTLPIARPSPWQVHIADADADAAAAATARRPVRPFAVNGAAMTPPPLSEATCLTSTPVIDHPYSPPSGGTWVLRGNEGNRMQEYIKRAAIALAIVLGVIGGVAPSASAAADSDLCAKTSTFNCLTQFGAPGRAGIGVRFLVTTAPTTWRST